MKTKRVIDKRERTTLVVDFETRGLVRYCAKKWGGNHAGSDQLPACSGYLRGRGARLYQERPV